MISASLNPAYLSSFQGLAVFEYQKYLFALIDDQTRFWLAEQVADIKGKSDVRQMFEKGRDVAGKRPTVLISDGARNYQSGIRKAWWNPSSKLRTVHMRHVHLNGDVNNNKMERFNEEVRGREKTMRGFKNTDDNPILKGYKIYHNFIREHQGLEGKTPAELAGIKVEGENKWITLIQNASKPEKLTITSE